MPPVLTLKEYKVYYRTLSGYVKAVDGVNFVVNEGEIVGLVGESGCGKSTLVLSLVLPKPPMIIMGGEARLREIDLVKLTWRERRRILLIKLSLIPQYALNALPVIKKIRDLLKDIARDKEVDQGEIIELFKERIRFIGLPQDVLEMYPLELSGGMRQRVVIAISTLFSPDLLIADEPTSALDVTTQRHVIELFTELRNTGIIKSLIFVTHDIATVRQIADKLAVMYAGKIVEYGDLEDIIKDSLHPYTKALISAVPTLGINYKWKRLKGLSGSPPSLLNPPKGCRFHPRCPYAMNICSAKEPPEYKLDHRIVYCWLYSQEKVKPRGKT